MMPAPVLVSVLVPAFNEEENVARAHAAIAAVFDSLPDYQLELIFTDNHSTDRTFERLRAIARRDGRVSVYRFSRNVGYHRSVLFAYQQARGSCAILLDCDLQDPPELIPAMLMRWSEGHQVVYGIRTSLPDGAVTAGFRRIFYRGIRALSDDDLPVDAGEFRLVGRPILDELRLVDDTSPYVRGLISSMGFSQVGIPYDRRERVAGTSKFPLRRMVSMALDGLLNHSMVPLRLASGIALVVGAVTFLLILGYLIGRLFFGQDWPAGFATTTLLLLLSITLNAMCFGILGEYLGRVFQQTKGRPKPIVELALLPGSESSAGAGTRMPASAPSGMHEPPVRGAATLLQPQAAGAASRGTPPD